MEHSSPWTSTVSTPPPAFSEDGEQPRRPAGALPQGQDWESGSVSHYTDPEALGMEAQPAGQVTSGPSAGEKKELMQNLRKLRKNATRKVELELD